MPVIRQSSYKRPPSYQFDAHLQTIIPGLFRKVDGIRYERERLELKDGDFVDLDWIDNKSKKLVILTHGLEGDSKRPYMLGMAKYFSVKNWDVLAWNCRSCSGEMNRKMRLYSHGEIDDIHEVISHAQAQKSYDQIVLIGFSMGGCITLKYLGVQGKSLASNIKTAVAISAPCHLKSCIDSLNKKSNLLYRNRFMKKLKRKMTIKSNQFPNIINTNNFKKVKEWMDFDAYFSAPINGFSDVKNFYEYASAINYIDGIKIPTLLLNAQNDPIVPKESSPTKRCEKHPFLYLETPKHGGHVGFILPKKEFSWAEIRAFEFAA